MRHASLTENVPCPVGRSLEIIGEWWTLLIVRDALHGAKRFDEFKETGMADNVLASRLQKLTASGILERKLYQKRPPRYEYLLTEKGRSLAPVILALRTWGRQFTKGADPSIVEHVACGHDVTMRPYCKHCDKVLGPGSVEISRAS